MISVIIPLYNKEHYIAQTLNSVLNQTYTDFEVIIVNDGSTDKSTDIVLGFKDKRIKLINQDNKGVSAARNSGINMAKGDFLAFLDADDEWYPEYLEKMHNLTIIYHNYSVFCTGQTNRPIPTLPQGVSIIEDHCKYNYVYFTGCMLIRTEIFKTIGLFREGIQLGEDRDMWLRICCKHNTVYLNEELVNHPYYTENNLARTIDTKKSFPYWEWYNYTFPLKRSLYRYTTEMLVECAMTLTRQKRYKDALYFLLKTRGTTTVRARLKLLIKIILKK